MTVKTFTPNNSSLQDTINDAVSKQTRNLQNQIKDLRKQLLASKNAPPGATKHSATTTGNKPNDPNQKQRPAKNKSALSKPGRTSRQPSGQKAVDAANDSTSEPRKSASTDLKKKTSRNNNRKSSRT